jgi:hypothetical protein
MHGDEASAGCRLSIAPISIGGSPFVPQYIREPPRADKTIRIGAAVKRNRGRSPNAFSLTMLFE